MPKKSLNNNKKRFSVTLTQPYIDALDRLVKEGLYMDHQGGIRHALRQLFRFHGIEPVYNNLVEEKKES
jgi:Arc/MetJ-type ribon-helix-helix transcriptional regulator